MNMNKNKKTKKSFWMFCHYLMIWNKSMFIHKTWMKI
jgi:hypothetical protein